MRSFAWRPLAGSRWRQPMMAYSGCFVPMCWAESQVGSMCSAISLEEVAIVACRWGPGRVGGWRCLAVEGLSQVQLRADAWHTEPRSPQQTCIDEIDFDADAQSGDNPQKGQ